MKIEERLKIAIEKLYAVNIKLDEKIGMEPLQELGTPASNSSIENLIKKVGQIPKSCELFLRLHNGWKYYLNSEANLLSVEDHEQALVKDSIQQHLDCFINFDEIVPDSENPFKTGFPIELGENRSFAVIDQTTQDADGEMKVKLYTVENKKPFIFNNFLEYIENRLESQERLLGE